MNFEIIFTVAWMLTAKLYYLFFSKIESTTTTKLIRSRRAPQLITMVLINRADTVVYVSYNYFDQLPEICGAVFRVLGLKPRGSEFTASRTGFVTPNQSNDG